MRISTKLAAAAFVVLVAAPTETLASCQTEWCHQQWRLHLRESEIAARQRLAAAPDDAEAGSTPGGSASRATSRGR
jgi:hypothetical protein